MGKPIVQYEKVKAKRGKRIRRLWRRKGVLYVQLRVTNPKTGEPRPQKLALDKTISTIPQALQAAAEMRVREKRGELRRGTGVPTFGEYVQLLFEARRQGQAHDGQRNFLPQLAGRFFRD